ncbi:carbohydrate ABC transporter permease [Caldicellulosiruptor changbaiensis]|uniref:Binding-protein-dependent transport systems inner membrane component n=2 Tax=Caldicellulosiruptor TaxID=44000 RepID=A4XM59_CALS8|nr:MULTISPECIES: carbohydrate ABC transporter permease [Caldicellulosiruptor]ABP67994.1 binding-protein-dependent transport systems inner membrane component [Caldicellulosiruptor saccharolyticus DSM 8903]AZT91400.1 carbohydrate ABC transporter permease [Caldicellulosiruptor changbaiensis]
MSKKATLAWRKQNRSLAGNLVIFAILAILGVFMALPLIYTIVNAFKPFDEIFIFPPRLYVRRPTLDNFVLLFQLATNMWVPFSRYVFNSLFICVVGTVGHILIASLAAYPLAKHQFAAKRIINEIIVLALLFTPQVTYIPLYIIMSNLRLIDTYGALIFPAWQMTLGLFLMRQFMTQIPDALLEAAKIDGASELKTWWRIVMPNVKPAWLTLMILSFQQLWNQTGGSFIFSESLKPLPTLMSQIAAAGIARAGVGAAVALVLMIPPIILFIISQSSVMETMVNAGIK